MPRFANRSQTANYGGKKAQKFGAVTDDDDDELAEESLLETPLDRIEPYGMFKGTLMSKWPTTHCCGYID